MATVKPVRTTRRTRFLSPGAGRLLPALLWSVAIVVPMVYLVLASFRTRQEYSANPLGWPTTLAWDNYTTAWQEGNLAIAFVNTFIVTVLAVAGVVLLASLAAYGIARWVGRLGPLLYAFFVLGLIVPFQLGLPTLYKIVASLGLVDTIPGVVIVHIGAHLPLAVFLYAGFLLTVPLELEEAARVDGAGDVRIYTSIVFPLLKPVTATVVILTAIGVWNDLLISIYFLQSATNQTLSRATLNFMSTYNSDIPVVYASAVIIVVPILLLFVVLQRFFIAGLTQGSIRG